LKINREQEKIGVEKSVEGQRGKEKGRGTREVEKREDKKQFLF